jgi:hypothetical protein
VEDMRARIVVYYAIWTMICAAVAGSVIALIHTLFFSYNSGPPAFVSTLVGGIAAAVAIASGQGAVALLTGGIMARLGKTLRFTVLLGLLIGLFDFVMYFLQMAVPATELGWTPDLLIIVVVTAVITVAGARNLSGVGAGAGSGATG